LEDDWTLEEVHGKFIKLNPTSQCLLRGDTHFPRVPHLKVERIRQKKRGGLEGHQNTRFNGNPSQEICKNSGKENGEKHQEQCKHRKGSMKEKN